MSKNEKIQEFLQFNIDTETRHAIDLLDQVLTDVASVKKALEEGTGRGPISLQFPARDLTEAAAKIASIGENKSAAHFVGQILREN